MLKITLTWSYSILLYCYPLSTNNDGHVLHAWLKYRSPGMYMANLIGKYDIAMVATVVTPYSIKGLSLFMERGQQFWEIYGCDFYPPPPQQRVTDFYHP